MTTDVIKSVKTAGGDYTSLVAAEAGEQRDLVALDEQSIIELYPMIDTSNNIGFSGWGTDDNHWLIIRTPATNSHPGGWDDGVWHQKTPIDMMWVDVRNIKLIGLQFKFQQWYSGLRYIIHDGVSTAGHKTYVLKCIFRGVEPVAGNGDCCIIRINWPTLFLNNCLFYDFLNAQAVQNGGSSSLTYANNNTIIDFKWIGLLRRYGTLVAKNNLIKMPPGYQGYGYYNGMSAGSINNAYDNTTDPGTNGLNINGYAGTDIFEDYANDNFHLKAGSPCIDMGADLTADSSMILKDDIDGVLRTGAWDMGADERTALNVSRLKKPQDRLLRAMLMR